MKQLKKDLKSVTKDLKSLTKKTETMAKRLAKIEKTQIKKKSKAKAKVKTTKKRVAKRKVAKKNIAKKRVAKKAKRVTAIDTVMNIIKRSSKGLDSAALQKKTGFEQRKIRDLVYRLKKQGKIKSPKKGVYLKK